MIFVLFLGIFGLKICKMCIEIVIILNKGIKNWCGEMFVLIDNKRYIFVFSYYI